MRQIFKPYNMDEIKLKPCKFTTHIDIWQNINFIFFKIGAILILCACHMAITRDTEHSPICDPAPFMLQVDMITISRVFKIFLKCKSVTYCQGKLLPYTVHAKLCLELLHKKMAVSKFNCKLQVLPS